MSGCHSPYTMGNVAYSLPSNGGYCNCLCHNPWNGVFPPTCYCQCNRPFSMPSNSTFTPTIIHIENKKMEEKIKALQDRISILEMRQLDQCRKPYSCPRCSDSSDRNHTKNCISCEGKGIVWG